MRKGKPLLWIHQNPISINKKHDEEVSELIYLGSTISAPMTQSNRHFPKAFPSLEIIVSIAPNKDTCLQCHLSLTTLYASKTLKRQWQAIESSTPSTKHASGTFLKILFEYRH